MGDLARKDVVLRRPAGWSGVQPSTVVVSEWDVIVRATGERIGSVVQDDVGEWESGGARSLWHAYVEGFDEAVGDRHYTREGAVHEVLREAP